MNETVKDWLEEVKRRYAKDTMKTALAEGRVLIRTLLLQTLHNDVSANNEDKVGERGLKSLGTKLTNSTDYPQGISGSILPTKPFNSNARKVGVLTTLPYQEDLQKYKEYINKDFAQKHNIDPKLIEEAKQYFTRVSYYDKDDLLAEYEKSNKKHYRPDFKYNSKNELQTNARNYQDLAKNPEFHNSQTHNEALVKVRQSSTICVTALDEENLKHLMDIDAKKMLPNSHQVSYTLFNPQTNIVKFVDEEHYKKTNEIKFTHEVDATKAQRKPLKLVKQEENFYNNQVKAIDFSGLNSKLDPNSEGQSRLNNSKSSAGSETNINSLNIGIDNNDKGASGFRRILGGKKNKVGIGK